MFLSYSRLKNDFLQMYSPYINDTNLFKLKNFFEKDLNSVRRLSYCNNLDKLIKLLEKADILNEDNVTPLKQIVTNIGEQNLSNFLPYIELYENQPTIEVPRTNLTYNQSNTAHHQSPVISGAPPNLPPVIPSAPPYVPPVIPSAPQSLPNIQQNYPQNNINALQPNFHTDDVIRDKCFKIIAERLGYKWKEVGRALGLREGDMDVITKKYKNNMPAQTLEMLHRFEEEPLYERRTLRTRLTDALRKAKRQDLVINVADVFDRHS